IRDLIVTGVQTCALPILALEYFEAAPFAFRRDHSRTIDALAQPGNFRQIVQDSEATGVSYFSDQAENRIGADVDESRSSWTHRRSEERRVGKECRSRGAR